MMQVLRNIGALVICVMFMTVQVACSSADEPVERLRPSLSATALSLEVGKTAILQVANVEDVPSATTDAPTIISLNVDGANIEVTALKEGEAQINVNVAGARLNCKVTVVALSTPIYDFGVELQDERCRYVSPSLSMYYDTPGTIFSISNDNMIEVRSLITGDNVSFVPGGINLIEGNLEKASLQVNGNNMALKSATLYRLAPDGSMWYHLIDENGNNIVLVVTEM